MLLIYKIDWSGQWNKCGRCLEILIASRLPLASIGAYCLRLTVMVPLRFLEIKNNHTRFYAKIGSV